MEQQIHGGNIYDKNIYNKEITLDYSVNINPLGMPQGSYKEAADINRDGVIDLYDFVAIKRHILNIGYIQQ